MLIPGQTTTLTIEKPAAGGRMIARHEGQVVLVSGAIPGERVRARVERVSKSLAFADTVDVEHASPDRRPWTDLSCGGALLAHIGYARQLEIKSDIIADAFARIARVPLPTRVPVAPSPEEGYRMRARLHVRGGRIGFFREGTHDLCDPRQTRQLLPATCDTIERLSAALRSVGGAGVDEIEVAENIPGTERAIALQTRDRTDAAALRSLGNIDGLTGIAAPGVAVGATDVRDRFDIGNGCVVSLVRSVHAFFQGNRYLLPQFVTHVVDQVHADDRVLDLYAGVGLFAVGAATMRNASVTAVEGDRAAEASLLANAASVAAHVRAERASVESFIERAQPGSATCVIVDPPRTGMSRAALDGVLRLRAPRLIYVSCDVATLARDTRVVVDAGYAVTRADAFDLFPNTPHVESVVVFERPA